MQFPVACTFIGCSFKCHAVKLPEKGTKSSTRLLLLLLLVACECREGRSIAESIVKAVAERGITKDTVATIAIAFILLLLLLLLTAAAKAADGQGAKVAGVKVQPLLLLLLTSAAAEAEQRRRRDDRSQADQAHSQQQHL